MTKNPFVRFGFRAMLMSAATEGSAAAEEAPVAEAPAAEVNRGPRQSFTDEQIKKIRSLRAEVHPAGDPKAGQPVYSHKKLADEFNTTAGVISQIVRNRTYKDPDYKPTNDGFRDKNVG